MQKRLRGMILGVTVLFVAFWVYADDVTISTFYPSPYGSYKNLDTTSDTSLATDDGKVGIGTKTPFKILEVHAGTDQNVLFRLGSELVAGAGGVGIQSINDTHNTAMPITIQGSKVVLSGSGNNDLYINTSGNVGIGTTGTGPVSKLHVHGNYNNDGTGGFMLDATDASDPEKYVLRINPFVIAGSKVGYQFQTKSQVGGTQIPLTFDNAGNVGIGTTGPGAPLDVMTSAGNSRIQLTSESGTPKIKFRNSADSGYISSFFDATQHIFEISGTEKVRIDPSGNVIVVGNITAGTVTASSDTRFKTDLKPLTGILPKLDELQGVNYEPSKLAVSQGRPAGHRELGIVGQELEKVFPELVLRSGPEEYRSVDYSRLSVVLLEAVKELKTQMETLKSDRARLEDELNTLKAEIHK